MFNVKDIYTHANEPIRRGTQLVNLESQNKETFITRLINDHFSSEFFKNGVTSYNYYHNNGDITKKERNIVTKGGSIVKSDILANTQMQHNFLYKLIKQKRSFLLSKPFTIDSDLEDTESNNEYMKEINDLFKKPQRELLKSVITDSMLYGIGWIQKYYDEYGNLNYKKIPSLEVIPIWEDSEHKLLNAVIRAYEVIRYVDDKEETIRKVELYDRNGVWYYEQDPNGDLKADSDIFTDNEKVTPYPNFYKEVPKLDAYGRVLHDEDGSPIYEMEGQLFTDIPFIPVKYNSEEISLLELLKSLIDSYDNLTSVTADELRDIQSTILAIKGYSGKNAEEFLYNLNSLRAVFLQGDGGIDSLQNTIDTTATEALLDRIKEDIYDIGMCVNTQADNLDAASGVALERRYRDLQLDCEDLATEVEEAVLRMIYDYLLDKMARGEEVLEAEFRVVFNMDLPSDEAAVISNVKNSIGVISKSTAIANHPWVTNVMDELDQLKKEQEESIEYEVERMDALYNDEQGLNENQNENNNNENE